MWLVYEVRSLPIRSFHLIDGWRWKNFNFWKPEQNISQNIFGIIFRLMVGNVEILDEPSLNKWCDQVVPKKGKAENYMSCRNKERVNFYFRCNLM